MMVGNPYGTADGTFARRGQAAHFCVGSSWNVTFGIFCMWSSLCSSGCWFGEWFDL